VEYVEKQPSLEDVFLALTGDMENFAGGPADGTVPAGKEVR
jgi:hypothetical protein